jgi:pectate lyase-like protein
MGATGLLAGGAAVAVTDATSRTQADAATTTTTPGWINVTSYGADPTGANDSAAAFNSAVKAVADAGGGVVYIPAGNYKVASTVTCTAVPVYFVGDGAWATIISFTGTGDCFRIYDSSTYLSRTKFGGGVVGITIDGSNAGAASTGLHVGDLLQRLT